MDKIFVRFGSSEQKIDALQSFAFSHEGDMAPRFLYSQPDVMHVPATDAMRVQFEALGAQIFEDVQFQVMPGYDGDDDYDEPDVDQWSKGTPLDLADGYSMRDVVEQVRAPEAWTHTRGAGVTIAIIDTGIAGDLKEFSAHRRSRVDLETVYQGQHWIDTQGHGSMCAAIAAGSRSDGGRYDGVAPGATVLAARSTLKATDLTDIYDELLRARVERQLLGPLVVSNSYGLRTCVSPGILPPDHPFMGSILAAINDGIFVCFAAGNNHRDVCQHDPTSCGPNTIWGPNSHDRIVSVGTVNRDLTNCDPATPHVNSSRGPGEWHSLRSKPDCVAPTYGEVLWGTSFRRMRWWGTSGACPQVAGAAALMLSVNPGLTPDQVGQIIRETCSLLPEGKTCVGRGLLDCSDAVEKAKASLPTS